MLDLTGILFSSIMMLLVIFRAVQLDAMLPWFKPLKTSTDSSGLRLRPDAAPAPMPAPVQSAARAGRARVTRTR